MELHSSTLILLTVLLMLLIKNKMTRKPQQKLPPGPWKLPIIGSLHHLAGASPHDAIRNLARRHGPIMHLKLGQIDHIVVSSPKLAQEVAKAQDLNFASRPPMMATRIILYGPSDIAHAHYGHYWRQLRKLCVVELLNVRRVKMFSHIRDEESFRIVETIAAATAGSAINLAELLIALTNRVISRATFGKGCKHERRFIKAMLDAIELASSFNLPDLFPSLAFLNAVNPLKFKLEKIHRHMDEIMSEIISEHQVKPRSEIDDEDVVDVLLRINEEGDLDTPLTLNNIKAVIIDLFAGGTDTGSSTMECVMAELIRHPEAMKKAQAEVRGVLKQRTRVEEDDVAELNYLKLVIKETLRLNPPLPLLLPRLSHETCEVGGYTVPKGSTVHLNVWALGRDQESWEEPEMFKPERFEGSSVDFRGGSFEFLPFGAGRRICPGMVFGLANMELMLARLLFHFDWELPGGVERGDVDMEKTFGGTVRRKNNLQLIAKPYVSLNTTIA